MCDGLGSTKTCFATLITGPHFSAFEAERQMGVALADMFDRELDSMRYKGNGTADHMWSRVFGKGGD